MRHACRTGASRQSAREQLSPSAEAARRPDPHRYNRPHAGAGLDPAGWRAALEEVLFEHQAPDGSWDPVGVWGRSAGRVFSTSMATLALLAPCAYPRGCFDPRYRRRLHPTAYRLLER